MHFPTQTSILALTALTPFAAAYPKPPHAAKTGKAIYTITNGENNSVLALNIQDDGKLGPGKLTATLGKGASSVNATGQSVPTDVLASQGALTIAGEYIFATNPGSDTVSMLSICNQDPTQLRLVGKPAKLPGTFPNTVAASTKNSLVCVGTSGSKAGVSCGTFDKQNGIGEMRQISSFALNQTDPPSGPLNTVSHTFFSADEKMLFTTVKGNPMVNNTGYLSTVPVKKGANGDCEPMVGTEVRSSPEGTAVLFGSQVIPGANPPKIFATDASFGAAVLSVDSTGKATSVGHGVVKGQKATCWVAISPATGTAFVTDVAVNRLVEMSLSNASVVGQIDLSMGASAMNPGLIDLRAAGDFVYALSPGNGTSQPAISVVDVKSRTLVQNAELGSLGVRNTAQGMAVLL